MKHCPTCKQKYTDHSLNFCFEDGSELTFFDTEAETLKNTPSGHVSGFKAAYSTFPLDHVVKCFRTARTRVLIFANWFPNTIQIEQSVVAAARNGSEVQIMLLNPESTHAQIRSHDLGYRDSDSVSHEIVGTLKELSRFVEKEGIVDRIHVRLHDFTPTYLLFGWHDAVLFGVYLATVHALQGPFMEFGVQDSPMGQALLKDFEKKWASAQPYSLQPNIKHDS